MHRPQGFSIWLYRQCACKPVATSEYKAMAATVPKAAVHAAIPVIAGDGKVLAKVVAGTAPRTGSNSPVGSLNDCNQRCRCSLSHDGIFRFDFTA
jgi:hypothetical protein